jgi:stress response protein YsnF
VVRENVTVGKKAVEDVRELSGEVRREELIIESPTDRVKS